MDRASLGGLLRRFWSVGAVRLSSHRKRLPKIRAAAVDVLESRRLLSESPFVLGITKTGGTYEGDTVYFDLDFANAPALPSVIYITPETGSAPTFEEGIDFTWDGTVASVLAYVTDNGTPIEIRYFDGVEDNWWNWDPELLNVAPSGSMSNNGPIDSEEQVTVSFSASDASADSNAGLHYSFALNADDLATSYEEAGTSSTAPFTLDRAGTYTVYGIVYDKDGASAQRSTNVTVGIANSPLKPSMVHGLAISSSEIYVSWFDNATNETAFKIQYSTDNFSTFKTVIGGVDTVSKWLTGLAPSTTYSIRVIATNGDGDSNPSSAITVTTPASEALAGGRTVRNVTSYGATPNNDSDDDRSAIQSAINASSAGDIIYFPAGTYKIGDRLNVLGGGRIYLGVSTFSPDSYDPNEIVPDSGGSIIYSSKTDVHSSNRAVFNITSNQSGTGYNMKFSNLTFRGAGIYGDSVDIDRVVVSDCFFDVTHYTGSISGGGDNVGIQWTTKLQNSAIVNNLLSSAASWSIYAYSWDNLVIANNQFSPPSGQASSVVGLHLDGQATQNTNLIVEQNHFIDIKNQAVELQGKSNASSNPAFNPMLLPTFVQDNYYENDLTVNSTNYTSDSYAFSMPLDGQIVNNVHVYFSFDSVSRRNYILAQDFLESPTDLGTRYIFELGGKNLNNYDNYWIEGNKVSVTDGDATGTVHGNRYTHYNGIEDVTSGSIIGKTNNSTSTTLSWDLNRPVPGPHRRVSGLAIDLNNQVLTIHGTAVADTFAVAAVGSNLQFILNGEEFVYPAASISKVVFEAQATPNSASGVVIMKSLSIPSGLTLDLTNNSMIVDYTGSSSPISTIASLIQSGFNGGTWDGEGIISSLADDLTAHTYALGYGDNAELMLSAFAGQDITGLDTVLIKYTYYGDANLDGMVNLYDLVLHATHWQTSAYWNGADFDYDFFVDSADLGLLGYNWQAGVGGPLRGDGGQGSEPTVESVLEEMGLSQTEIDSFFEILGSNAHEEVL